MLKENKLSKGVKMYLEIEGKKVEDLNKKFVDEFDGQTYFTDFKENILGRILVITEDGQEFEWIQL